MSLRYILDIDGIEERDLGFLTADSLRHITINVASLSAGTTHSFRIKAVDTGGRAGDFSEVFYQDTAPYSDALLTAFDWIGYHDAEALVQPNGSNVTNFTDYSGHHNHFLAVLPNPAPTFLTVSAQLNNKKAVRFNDVDANQMLEAAWNPTGVCTVFLVGWYGSLGSQYQNMLFSDRSVGPLWQFGSNTSNDMYFIQDTVIRGLKNPSPRAVYILRIEHRATETKTFLNGVDITVSATSTRKPTLVTLGHVPAFGQGFFQDSHIGFVGCSDGLITGADAVTCENFWIARYGL